MYCLALSLFCFMTDDEISSVLLDPLISSFLISFRCLTKHQRWDPLMWFQNPWRQVKVFRHYLYVPYLGPYYICMIVSIYMYKSWDIFMMPITILPCLGWCRDRNCAVRLIFRKAWSWVPCHLSIMSRDIWRMQKYFCTPALNDHAVEFYVTFSCS